MNMNKAHVQRANQTPLALGKRKRHRGYGMRRLESRSGKSTGLRGMNYMP
jgi:hypothetical protein